jgi:hypothetical protein
MQEKMCILIISLTMAYLFPLNWIQTSQIRSTSMQSTCKSHLSEADDCWCPQQLSQCRITIQQNMNENDSHLSKRTYSGCDWYDSWTSPLVVAVPSAATTNSFACPLQWATQTINSFVDLLYELHLPFVYYFTSQLESVQLPTSSQFCYKPITMSKWKP